MVPNRWTVFLKTSAHAFTTVLPEVWNVAQVGIMAAMYMGGSQIYLLGLDHDWMLHHGAVDHFYDGPTIEGHPKGKGDISHISYMVDLQADLDMWKAYEGLRNCSARLGIEIFNATHGGVLDVFERVSYESLFTKRTG